jgi:hypothetical protein
VPDSVRTVAVKDVRATVSAAYSTSSSVYRPGTAKSIVQRTSRADIASLSLMSSPQAAGSLALLSSQLEAAQRELRQAKDKQAALEQQLAANVDMYVAD